MPTFIKKAAIAAGVAFGVAAIFDTAHKDYLAKVEKSAPRLPASHDSCTTSSPDWVTLLDPKVRAPVYGMAVACEGLTIHFEDGSPTKVYKLDRP